MAARAAISYEIALQVWRITLYLPAPSCAPARGNVDCVAGGWRMPALRFYITPELYDITVELYISWDM